MDVLSNGELDFVKTKVKDAVVSSDRSYNANLPHYLFNEELETLRNLHKNTKLVVCKADKHNSMA